MVRSAARSEPLPELSARSAGARATQPPVAAGVTPPEIIAVALAANTATPPDSTVADGAVAAESVGGAERERLLHDMASARRRARTRSRTRLFATASVVIVVALGALTSGGMLFFRQQADSSVQATALAASVATQTEVAYARPAPYTDEMPGARCPGAHGEGVWKPDSAQSPQVTCAQDIGVAYLASVARDAKPYLLRLMLGHLIASAYKMSVSASFTDLYTCVGLVFFGEDKASSRVLFELCDSGVWHVLSQVNAGSLSVLAQGRVDLAATNDLEIAASPSRVVFTINGANVKTLTLRHPASAPDDYLGLYIREGAPSMSSRVSAEFSNFSYQPG